MGNCARGFRWSPDGLCFLSATDDGQLHLFELAPMGADPLARVPTFACATGGSVYDFAWLPRMNSADPSSCLFASASRDHPVALWDAFTGLRVRALIARGVDADAEAIDRAFALEFTRDSTELLAGTARAVHTFDIESGERLLSFELAREVDSAGNALRGMVGALAVHPDPTLALAAVGTYGGAFALVSTRQSERASGVVRAHASGVTQLQFSADGVFVFSGGRRDDAVLAWDTRRLDAPVARLARHAPTNQRLQFDISGAWLATPSFGPRGAARATAADSVLVYDLAAGGVLAATVSDLPAVNAVAWHPLTPMLGVTCGRRSFSAGSDGSDDSGDEVAARAAVPPFAIAALSVLLPQVPSALE